jgi:hypothetical protein
MSYVRRAMVRYGITRDLIELLFELELYGPLPDPFDGDYYLGDQVMYFCRRRDI